MKTQYQAGTQVRTTASIFLPRDLRNVPGTVVGAYVCPVGDEWVRVVTRRGDTVSVLPELLKVEN